MTIKPKKNILDRDAAIDGLTLAYLGGLDMDSLPAPADAASGLLAFIADRFREHNAGVSVEERWDMPEGLAPRQIAQLVMALCDVRMLPWPGEADTSVPREGCRLYVRQADGPEKGLYTTDVLSVIDGFQPGITLFDEQDVEAWLRAHARMGM